MQIASPNVGNHCQLDGQVQVYLDDRGPKVVLMFTGHNWKNPMNGGTSEVYIGFIDVYTVQYPPVNIATNNLASEMYCFLRRGRGNFCSIAMVVYEGPT